MTLEFYECEHNGDLDNYITDIEESGGKVISSELNYDREVGIVVIDVADDKVFMEKFSNTDAYGFIN